MSDGKFAVILEEKITIENIRKLLFDSIFSNVIELAIYVPNGESEKYAIYGRDPETEAELSLINFLQNGQLVFDQNEVFPPNRLQNFHGQTLKATSFQFPPFCYKDNPNDPDEEYKGFETNIFKDISKALNFNFELNTPTDGGLWGEIFSNGTATGLGTFINHVNLVRTDFLGKILVNSCEFCVNSG